jgi:hypothetical protein
VRSRVIGRKLKDVQELPISEAAALLPLNAPDVDVVTGEDDDE